MTRQEFSDALRQSLAGLPQEDLERSIDFYQEMIDDRMEDGLSEAEAVAAIGSVDEVANQFLKDTPLTKLVREKIRPRRKMKAWEIVLLAVGSPIWASLLIAAAAVVFGLYVVLWSLVISLWAVGVSVAGCSIGCIAWALALLAGGNVWPAAAVFGTALLCAGLSIFLFWLSKTATVGTARLAKKIFIGIKSCFIRKEAA